MFNSNKLKHKKQDLCYMLPKSKQNKIPTEQFRTWLVTGIQASERHF